MSFQDDARDTDPAPSPAGRLRSAVLHLDEPDVSMLADLAERLAEERREAVRGFDAPKRMCGKGREG